MNWQEHCKHIQSLLFTDNQESLFSEQSFNDQIESYCKELPATLAQRVREEFLGYGPLQQLLDQEEVTEILCNSFDQIYYEKEGNLHKLQDQFYSSTSYEVFIQRFCQDLDLQPSVLSPFANSKFRNFRVHLCWKSAVGSNYFLSLRRLQMQNFPFARLASMAWANPEELSYLENSFKNKKNLLIVGPTSSGKTTILNSLLQLVQKNERVLILEDSDELQAPNRNSIKLVAHSRGEKPIYLQELVKESLRMRPDRFGEVRGEEALALMLALSTGHQGSLSTLHAASAHEALLRLEMLVQMGNHNWSQDLIRKTIRYAVDEIIVVKKNPSGHRYLEGISRVLSLEPSGWVLESAINPEPML